MLSFCFCLGILRSNPIVDIKFIVLVKQMRLLGLVVSMAAVLYLVTSAIGKQSQNSASDKSLLDRPAEVKSQVNKALEKTEKARQDALNQSTSTSN
jgi:hypothetical protein